MNDREVFMNNILLIGAGQLGSRHLQALSYLSDEVRVFVVDPSTTSLKNAEQRYGEVKTSTSPLVCYFNSVEDIRERKFNIAIIATSAKERLSVLEEITSLLNIRYMILEKVLFQSLEQLERAQKLLKSKHIGAWVNCPRRMYDLYNSIKDDNSLALPVNIKVSGNSWGMACNSIHFIDLWHYLNEFASYAMNYSADSYVINSKRSGYKEIIGSISASSNNGAFLELNCNEITDENVNLSIYIIIGNTIYEINEITQSVKIKINEDVVESKKIKVPFQSELTSKYIESLLIDGKCELTPFDESSMIHSEFISKTLSFMNSYDKYDGYELIPVT